mmetsp:Transcript_23171/g.55434  ORF Transcript_23171/g.55434 Transcript_23171/m.55434 type:complete len:231 (+) Transcript_23171:439-1131(+)
MASSSAIDVAMPYCGGIRCAASPRRVTRPLPQTRLGGLWYSGMASTFSGAVRRSGPSRASSKPSIIRSISCRTSRPSRIPSTRLARSGSPGTVHIHTLCREPPGPGMRQTPPTRSEGSSHRWQLLPSSPSLSSPTPPGMTPCQHTRSTDRGCLSPRHCLRIPESAPSAPSSSAPRIGGRPSNVSVTPSASSSYPVCLIPSMRLPDGRPRMRMRRSMYQLTIMSPFAPSGP